MKKQTNRTGRERLIFALDIGEDIRRATKWVDLLKDHVGMFKVGKEAFTHFGPLIVSEIRARAARFFSTSNFTISLTPLPRLQGPQ